MFELSFPASGYRIVFKCSKISSASCWLTRDQDSFENHECGLIF